jgi:protein gp37
MTAIEWTEKTWNPVVGCSKVSPGCAHCYAEEVHRTRLSGQGAYPAFRPWTPANAEHNVTLVPERLDQPLRWRAPRMVFVNSMSDLFHELVPDDYIWSVFLTMARCPQHTFQVLTKRPERMRVLMDEWADAAFERADDGWPLPNVWLGTSIENRRFVGRADDLRATPAAVRFVSAEPLLGPLVKAYGWRSQRDRAHAREPERFWPDHAHDDVPELDLAGIDWLIVGGESGSKHRPVDPEWVGDLRDACLSSRSRWPDLSDHGLGRTAFFFKQWGGRTPKAGGRELDGRTWDEFPVPR